jgi:hypothetical protein
MNIYILHEWKEELKILNFHASKCYIRKYCEAKTSFQHLETTLYVLNV